MAARTLLRKKHKNDVGPKPRLRPTNLPLLQRQVRRLPNSHGQIGREKAENQVQAFSVKYGRSVKIDFQQVENWCGIVHVAYGEVVLEGVFVVSEDGDVEVCSVD